MKNPGHKRSISGHSQPTQSKHSHNSLLNTMIRVNKIGGVASNLDSSAVANGTRPSISPFRKNTSREATPNTAILRNSAQTAKSNLENLNNNGSSLLNRNKLNNSLNNNGYNYNIGNKMASKKPPPMQPKRIQSSNNFVQKTNGLLNSVAGLAGSQRENSNLMNSFANNSQSGLVYNINNNNKLGKSNNSIKNNDNNSISNSNNKNRVINNNSINTLNSISYNISSSRNFFSKINNNNSSGITRNMASSKQIHTNQQRNLLSGMESSFAKSGHRSNRANNSINNNNPLKQGTKIIINNDNLTQHKFEKNLKTGKNRTINANAGSDYSNSPLNNSIEKSSTSSFNNSVLDRIKVNKSTLLLQQQKTKLNSINNNNSNININKNNSNNNSNNNSSNNKSNNDVLSSLLNSKNYSKSPNRKPTSPALLKNSSLYSDLNKLPNNLNIMGKPGMLIGNSEGNILTGNDLFSKIYSINAQSRKNLEISQKQNREKSKSPSPASISGSLNNLNILNNLKINKSLLAKNSKNLSHNNISNINNNNFSLKKLNVANSGNINAQTIQVNRIKNNLNTNINSNVGNNNNEVRGTILDMNSEEFINKITGKFGGRTKESFYAGGNNNNNNGDSRSNSNNNSHHNSNNNFKKEENILNNNANNISGGNKSNLNNNIAMSLGNYNENNKNSYNLNKENLNVFNNNGNNALRVNKFMNSNNNTNLNNSSKPNNYQGAANKKENPDDNLTKDVLNCLNLRQMQVNSIKAIILKSFT